MIKKEITMNDGRKYMVGFKEVGNNNEFIECHILIKAFFKYISVYNKVYIKGISPDYKEFAIWTIFNYNIKRGQQQELLSANWS